MFPFDVPADLSALSAEEFAAFAAQVRAHAEATLADDNATPDDLVATSELFASVTGEEGRRTELATAADAARTSLRAGLVPATAPTEPAPEPEPTPAPAPVAVTAAVVPVVVSGTIDEPAPVATERHAVMVASVDARGSGTELASFADAGRILEERLATYSAGSSGATSKAVQIGSSNRFVMPGGRSLVRHGNVAFRREFPADLRITDANRPMTVIEHAMNQRRLPGGSLAASTQMQVEQGRSLTAAAGWCAPSETIYDLCALETLDGILSLPEVQTTRGGFHIPQNGGPNFSSIYNGIGDDGDVILSEYDVINGTDKVCIEIPCPPFVEVRMDVAYLCLTGSLLQQRGYPEAVTRFSQGAMVALAHKVNESVIARMVAQSGSPITIAADASGDDAASALLSAVELAIQDMKYRNRMGQAETAEVVLPFWVMAPIRAALARRTGVAMLDVTDAQILGWFTTRHAVPHFVYDWQDAFSGQANSPGGATPITAFPANVSFLVYPAGTWVKQVRDVINLDTVYDNAMLTQNQFTALFVEDGFNVMKMCVDSRLYTVPVDPSGVTGCCP